MKVAVVTKEETVMLMVAEESVDDASYVTNQVIRKLARNTCDKCNCLVCSYRSKMRNI